MPLGIHERAAATAQQYVLLTVAAVLLLGASAHGVALPGTMQTSRSHSLHVETLQRGEDDVGKEPTLVSISETTAMLFTLHCSEVNQSTGECTGATRGDDFFDSSAWYFDEEHISFDSRMDPFWFYLMRRRRLNVLEWTGCGGLWRPEWNEGPAQETSATGVSPRHMLSHHAVCSLSTLSACGISNQDPSPSSSAAAMADGGEVQRDFQWLANFASAFLSAPLSWKRETSHHMRPVGAIASRGADVNTTKWCSYHHARPGTLCTQNVSPLLNGGRSGRGVEESLPEGIFRAAIESLTAFFSTPFHHLQMQVVQTPQPQRLGTFEREVKLEVIIRMSFVAYEHDFERIEKHWAVELGRFAELRNETVVASVFTGDHGASAGAEGPAHPAVDRIVKRIPKEWLGDAGLASLPNRTKSSSMQAAPELVYTIQRYGDDHGTYYLGVEVPESNSSSPSALREGNTILALLMFPLHLIRPSIHQMVPLTPRTPAPFQDDRTGRMAEEMKQGLMSRAVGSLLQLALTALDAVPLPVVFAAAARQLLDYVSQRWEERQPSGEETTMIEYATVDESTNVLVLLIRTQITKLAIEHHITGPSNATGSAVLRGKRQLVNPFAVQGEPGSGSNADMVNSSRARTGRRTVVPLLQIPFRLGWPALADLPHDANRYYLLPQPLAQIQPADVSVASSSGKQLDHQRALEWMWSRMRERGAGVVHQVPTTDTTTTWLRARNIVGTTMAVPDPAMVFNVLTLGLIPSSLLFASMARLANLQLGYA